MAKSTFGSGTIVTPEFLNGAQQLYFDSLDEDWHYDPLNKNDLDTSDVGNGLGTKFVTLDTRQTVLEPKIFHNSQLSVPGPIPPGTTVDQYRFTDKVTGVDPTAQKHLATKDYVDRMIAALNVPVVGYGTGNGTQVVINNNTINTEIDNTYNSTQGLTAALDLYDLQPRFKGYPIAYREWSYDHWTQYTETHFTNVLIAPDAVTQQAAWCSVQYEVYNGAKDNQVTQGSIYLQTATGVNIPITGHRYWGGLYNTTNNHGYGNPVSIDNNLIPLPKDGWSQIWGTFGLWNMRAFSFPSTFVVRALFYDYKTSQVYYIYANPVTNTTVTESNTYVESTTEILVLGPDRVNPVTLAGSGLGISQAVVDGSLVATATWSIDPSYIAGNPQYTGSTTLAAADMEILWEFVSRVGDLNNPADPINSNVYPGKSFGSGVNAGTLTNAVSGNLPAGEYMQVRVTATHPGKEPSGTTTLNFQTDSPSLTPVPSSFAMTALSSSSVGITWTAVGGVKYRVDIEERGDGLESSSKQRFVWSDFANTSQHYAPNSVNITGSAGNITVSSLKSGTTYRAIIKAVAPNALVSESVIIGPSGSYTHATGSVVQATTTGAGTNVTFTNAIKGTSKADLTSKVPSILIPAGTIGVVQSGVDKGVYIYDPNGAPDVWIIIAS